MKKCVVCQSTIEKGQFCDAHSIAKKNLEEKYPDWKNAYGSLSKIDYYKKLIDEEEIPIGDWAREVAEYLLKKEK